MVELKVTSNHWEMNVEVGNDWGEHSYMETRIYDSKEEVLKALKYRDYYEIVHSIKEVIEYDRVSDEYKEN